MSDNDEDEIRKRIDKLAEEVGLDDTKLAEHIHKNFSPEDVAQLTTILSLYSPLLETARLINSQLVLLEANGQSGELRRFVPALEEWNREYAALDERIKIFNSKETMQ